MEEHNVTRLIYLIGAVIVLSTIAIIILTQYDGFRELISHFHSRRVIRM